MPKGCYARGDWWWLRFAIAGNEYREPLHVPVRGAKEERLAEQLSAKRRAEIVAQIHHGIAAPVTWQDAAVAWYDVAIANKLRPKTIARYQTSLKQLGPHLEPLHIQDIDAATVRKIVNARRKTGVTNATIRRDLTALSQVLAHAVREGWRQDNPALTYDRKAVLERREPISLPLEADIAATIAACPKRFGDLVEFARVTGMRQEEIAALEHDRIDRRRRVAMIYRAKGRRARAVPLTTAALAILDRQPRYLAAPWCFWHMGKDADGKPCALRYENISSNFGRARIKAAQKAAQKNRPFTGFRFHDLRHLFAVEYLRDRGSVYHLQQVLGHATIGTTELYLDYLTPEESARALAAK
jgi:integrase/recombinase XerD